MMLRYQQQPDLIAADLDGETVMMSVSTGKYFSLRGIGQFIWELLAEPKTIDEVVGVIEARYEVGHEQARADCESFVNDLIAKDLLKKS